MLYLLLLLAALATVVVQASVVVTSSPGASTTPSPTTRSPTTRSPTAPTTRAPTTHAPTLAANNNEYCNSQPSLTSTRNSQSKYFSSMSTVFSKQSCYSSNSASHGQYLLFTPPVTGRYYALVRDDSNDIALEVRSGQCSGGAEDQLGCNFGLYYSTPRYIGFDSIRLEAGTKYMFVLSKWYSTANVTGDHVLQVGFCGQSCSSYTRKFDYVYTNDDYQENTYGGGQNYYYDEIIASQIPMIVVPIVLFFLSFFALLAFCRMDGGGKRLGEFDLPNTQAVAVLTDSMMGRLRVLAAMNWSVAMIVWFSNWATIWSVLAYAITVGIFLSALGIFYIAKTQGLSATSFFIAYADQLRLIALGSAALLVLHAILAFAQIGNNAAILRAACQNLGASAGVCFRSYEPYIAFGAISGLAMLALAPLVVLLAETLVALANGIKNGGGGGAATTEAQMTVVPAQPEQEKRVAPTENLAAYQNA